MKTMIRKTLLGAAMALLLAPTDLQAMKAPAGFVRDVAPPPPPGVTERASLSPQEKANAVLLDSLNARDLALRDLGAAVLLRELVQANVDDRLNAAFEAIIEVIEAEAAIDAFKSNSTIIEQKPGAPLVLPPPAKPGDALDI